MPYKNDYSYVFESVDKIIYAALDDNYIAAKTTNPVPISQTRRNRSWPNSPERTPPNSYTNLTKEFKTNNELPKLQIPQKQFDHQKAAFKAAQDGNVKLLKVLLNPTIPSVHAKIAAFSQQLAILDTQEKLAQAKMEILQKQVAVFEMLLMQEFYKQHGIIGDLASSNLSALLKSPVFENVIIQLTISEIPIDVPLKQLIVLLHAKQQQGNSSSKSLEQFFLLLILESLQSNQKQHDRIAASLCLEGVENFVVGESGEPNLLDLKLFKSKKFIQPEIELELLGVKIKAPFQELVKKFIAEQELSIGGLSTAHINKVTHYLVDKILISLQSNEILLQAVNDILNKVFPFLHLKTQARQLEPNLNELIKIPVFRRSSVQLPLFDSVITLPTVCLVNENLQAEDAQSVSEITTFNRENVESVLLACSQRNEQQHLIAYRDYLQTRMLKLKVKPESISSANRKLNFEIETPDQKRYIAEVLNELNKTKRAFLPKLIGAIIEKYREEVKDHMAAQFSKNKIQLLQDVYDGTTKTAEDLVKQVVSLFNREIIKNISEHRRALKEEVQKTDFSQGLIDAIVEAAVVQLKEKIIIELIKVASEALTQNTIDELVATMAEQFQRQHEDIVYSIEEDITVLPASLLTLRQMHEELTKQHENLFDEKAKKADEANKIMEQIDSNKKKSLEKVLEHPAILKRYYEFSPEDLPALKYSMLRAAISVDVKLEDNTTLLDKAIDKFWHSHVVEVLLEHEIAAGAIDRQSWLREVSNEIYKRYKVTIPKQELLARIKEFAQMQSASQFRVAIQKLLHEHQAKLQNLSQTYRTLWHKYVEEWQHAVDDLARYLNFSAQSLGDTYLADRIYIMKLLHKKPALSLFKFKDMDPLEQFHEALEGELEKFERIKNYGFKTEILLGDFILKTKANLLAQEQARARTQVDTQFEQAEKLLNDWKANGATCTTPVTLLTSSNQTIIGQLKRANSNLSLGESPDVVLPAEQASFFVPIKTF